MNLIQNKKGESGLRRLVSNWYNLFHEYGNSSYNPLLKVDLRDIPIGNPNGRPEIKGVRK